MLEFADEDVLGPKIKVVGVGGGGGNAVNTMIEAGIQGVDFIAANTDGQVLETNLAPTKVQIGRGLTKGLGAGANPEIGAAAAIEDAARLAEVLTGADMVFVTAGMGGGTGTGAAPVIAQVARDMGSLTVGVVTKPFTFEGLQRKKKANSGIEALAKSVDALIVIPNDRLVALAGMKMTMRESFAMVDNVCLNAVRGISDLVMVPGLINVDFADVRTIMTGMGRALMGSGRGAGDKRAVEAAEMAINSPLLEDVSINGATGILVNITGGPDLTLAEVNEACSLIQEAADPDANIIFGSVIDPNCGDEVRITVIATGFTSRATADLHPQIQAQPHILTGGRPHHGHGNAHGNRRVLDSQAPMAMHQMALPVQVPAYQSNLAGGVAPVAALAAPASSVTPYPPAPLGSPYAPALDHEPMEMGHDAYPTPGSFVHAPLTAHVGVAGGPGPVGGNAYANVGAGDWGVGGGGDRPNIRPPVPSPLSQPGGPGGGAGPGPGGNRRASGTGGNNMALPSGDDLGIEESEYDTPAYLRRSRGGASGHDYAAMSYRMPEK
jgi:cell division protein FtsZ